MAPNVANKKEVNSNLSKCLNMGVQVKGKTCHLKNAA